MLERKINLPLLPMAKWVKTVEINKSLWFNTQNDDFNFHHTQKIVTIEMDVN